MIKTKTLLVYSAILNVVFLILLVMINTYDASRLSSLKKKNLIHQQEIVKQEKIIKEVIAYNLVLDEHLYKNQASNDSLESVIEADRVRKLRLRNRVYELERESFRNVSDSAIIGIFSGIRFNPDSL